MTPRTAPTERPPLDLFKAIFADSETESSSSSSSEEEESHITNNNNTPTTRLAQPHAGIIQREEERTVGLRGRCCIRVNLSRFNIVE